MKMLRTPGLSIFLALSITWGLGFETTTITPLSSTVLSSAMSISQSKNARSVFSLGKSAHLHARSTSFAMALFSSYGRVSSSSTTTEVMKSDGEPLSHFLQARDATTFDTVVVPVKRMRNNNVLFSPIRAKRRAYPSKSTGTHRPTNRFCDNVSGALKSWTTSGVSAGELVVITCSNDGEIFPVATVINPQSTNVLTTRASPLITPTCRRNGAGISSCWSAWIDYLDDVECGIPATAPSPIMTGTLCSDDFTTLTCTAAVTKLDECFMHLPTSSPSLSTGYSNTTADPVQVSPMTISPPSAPSPFLPSTTASGRSETFANISNNPGLLSSTSPIGATPASPPPPTITGVTTAYLSAESPAAQSITDTEYVTITTGNKDPAYTSLLTSVVTTLLPTTAYQTTTETTQDKSTKTLQHTITEINRKTTTAIIRIHITTTEPMKIHSCSDTDFLVLCTGTGTQPLSTHI